MSRLKPRPPRESIADSGGYAPASWRRLASSRHRQNPHASKGEACGTLSCFCAPVVRVRKSRLLFATRFDRFKMAGFIGVFPNIS